MRRTASWIACCMVVCAVAGYAQEWERVSIVPPSTALKSVCITSAHVFAVGELGTLVRSTDFGLSWELIPLENFWLRRVRFATDSIGWIVGNQGFIGRTENAGVTWSTGTPVNQDVRDIWSDDGIHAVAVCELGYVYTTEDSGNTWRERLGLNRYEDDLLAVDFFDRAHGCAVGGELSLGSPRIWLTADSGVTWTQVSTPYRGWLSSVIYVTDSIIVATGRNGKVLRSADAGQNWDSVFAFQGNEASLREVNFANDSVGCAVANDGSVITTRDAGLTWVLEDDYPTSFQGIDILANGAGICVGENGVSHTTDFGESWSAPQALLGGDVLDIQFVDHQHGWMLTQQNALYTTEDSGQNWLPHRIPQPVDIVEFGAVTSSIAVVATENGVIFRTTDAGSTWVQANTDSSYSIWDFDFADSDTGYAVGNVGTILETYDGGSSWSLVRSGGPSLTAVHVDATRHVWAVGSSGVVLQKDESGWHQEAQFPPLVDFVGVHFSDSLNGTIIELGGGIVYTRDGGLNWHWASSLNRTLTSLNFVSMDTGWITGHYGSVLRTDDGGATWTQAGEVGTHVISCLSATAEEVWIGGYDGAVYRSYYSLSSDPSSPSVPDHYSLSVFPNPFNSVATVQFELPHAARVELSLFDILGRRAMTLSDQAYTAGAHTLALEADHLATGLYFMHLRSAEFSTTRKLLLVR